MEDRCPLDQWDWCCRGWHTTQSNFRGKYESRNTTPKANYNSKPSGERDTRPRSRSRGTDGKNNRAVADTHSKEAATRPADGGEWLMDPKLQVAMAALGFHDESALPTEKAVDEAFDRAMKKALNAADEKKVKLAFASVRTAIATQTQPSSTSSSQ